MKSDTSASRSLREFVIRGVLNVGIPVGIFAVTMIFLTRQSNDWHEVLSTKFVLALLLGAIPGGVVGGSLYGVIMWMFFGRRNIR